MRENIMLSVEKSTKEGIKDYAKRHHTSVSQLAEHFFMHLIESDSDPTQRFINSGRTYHY